MPSQDGSREKLNTNFPAKYFARWLAGRLDGWLAGWLARWTAGSLAGWWPPVLYDIVVG